METQIRDSDDQLAARLAEIARRLSETETLDHTLQRVVELAEDCVEGCDGASIMLITDGGRTITPASSSSVAHESDLAQFETDQGPSLGAIRQQQTLIIDDLATDGRWPDYAEIALELGVRSMLSFRLFMAEDTMGALNLYATTPRAFTARSADVGQLFASHAAVAMKAAITEAGLERALASRDVIGQAKGILMERRGIPPGAAFEELVALSQHENRPLRAVAEDIATTGEASEPPPGRP